MSGPRHHCHRNLMKKYRELSRQFYYIMMCITPSREMSDPDPKSKQSSFFMSLLFCLLFVSTNFVNKYVLSVLKFTYPTIFQGWQTLAGAIVLRLLIHTGYVNPLLKGVDRYSVSLWMPGMMFYLMSIYAGSRALANLPVPVFFCLQNTVLLFKAIIQLLVKRKLLSVCSYMMLMATLISSVAIAAADPQFSADGYFWMTIHVLSSGFIHVYSNLIRTRLKLDSLERLYCCYIYSVLMLAPCSYLLGDALEAVNYQYLYFTKFYLGCIFSGMLGILLNLSAVKLQESDFVHSSLDFSTVQGVAKILGSGTSVFIFPTVLTANFTFLLTVNQLCSMVVSDAVSCRPLPIVLSPSHNSEHPGSLPNTRQSQPHDLQDDVLSIDLD